jgi:3-isopropylmalate/(R)-2-methylmalate dehydratase small subunit
MNQAVFQVSGPHVLLQRNDIDTDALFPAEFLTVTTRTGMRQYLFADWIRNGNPEASFVKEKREVDIVVAGRNFGCGSSREHAVWALADYGVKAIIALSFGDIFRNNCVKNNVVAAQMTDDNHAALLRELAATDQPNAIELDVATSMIRLFNGKELPFTLASGHAEQLLSDEDDIDRTLKLESALQRYEAKVAADAPWLVAAL